MSSWVEEGVRPDDPAVAGARPTLRSRLLGQLRSAVSILTYPAPPESVVPALGRRTDAPVHRARIVGRLEETSHATTLVLDPGRRWPGHRPGQWTAITVEVDGVRHSRCYSLTSTPAPGGTVSVTVQSVPRGVVSGHLARQAAAGDVVHLSDPAGEFTRDPLDHSPALFVTGGSGLTPVMGMLRAADAAGAALDAVLLHHAPGPGRSLFTEELARLAARHPGLRVAWTWTGEGAPPPAARLSADRLDRECPDWTGRTTWVCGPTPLLDAAASVWESAGCAERLHVERFAPTAAAAGTGAGGAVRFRGARCTTTAGGARPLLDVAESAGLHPPSGCRMGVCRTCVTPLVDGSVVDLRDGRVTTGGGAMVQLCVTAALGDVELDL